jgi:hypothetical protein
MNQFPSRIVVTLSLFPPSVAAPPVLALLPACCRDDCQQADHAAAGVRYQWARRFAWEKRSDMGALRTAAAQARN